MKAMILAAGLGTRLKPWTNHHPKALAMVNGKSLLQRNVEYLQEFGIKEVVVNVHHFADQIVEAVETNKGWGSTITISDETNEVLETGGGLMKAATYVKGEEPFVLMNADILTKLDLTEMLNYHQEYLPIATLAVSSRQTSRYFLFDDDGNLVGWRTSPPDPLPAGERGEELTFLPVAQGNVNAVKEILKDNLSGAIVQRAFSGIHIIDPKIFSLIKQEGKFSMVAAYLDLMNDHTIKGFDHSGSEFVDVGKPESIEKAEKMFP